MDDKVNAFHLLFNPILDLHAPIKNIKIQSRPNPFVTVEIRSEIKLEINGESSPEKQMTLWFGQNIENKEMKLNASYVLLNKSMSNSRLRITPTTKDVCAKQFEH